MLGVFSKIDFLFFGSPVDVLAIDVMVVSPGPVSEGTSVISVSPERPPDIRFFNLDLARSKHPWHGFFHQTLYFIGSGPPGNGRSKFPCKREKE